MIALRRSADRATATQRLVSPPGTPALRPAVPPRRLCRGALAALALCLAAALGGGLGRGAASAGEPRGATPTGDIAEERLNVERRRAIRRGAAWIAQKQNRGGSYGDDKAIVAATSLATLALLADGSGMDRGPYGEKVTSSVLWLVDLIENPTSSEARYPRGYFHWPKDGSSRMHGQGYAMLALASALGTATERNGRSATRIRRALKQAVACCQSSQTATGGWGYEPTGSNEHEGSVTVTIAQALRAARDAGVLVSEEVVRHGLDYLRNSQKLVGRGPATTPTSEDGSFKYSMNMENSSYALTAAAISSFFLFGEYGRDKEMRGRIDRGIAYMRRRLASTLHTSDRPFFHYGHFYAAWAAWQYDGNLPTPVPGQGWDRDPASGDIERTTQFWGPWHAKMYRVLVDDQAEDGRWQPKDDRYAYGDLVPTTFAVLTLAIPDELLPIFQR